MQTPQQLIDLLGSPDAESVRSRGIYLLYDYVKAKSPWFGSTTLGVHDAQQFVEIYNQNFYYAGNPFSDIKSCCYTFGLKPVMYHCKSYYYNLLAIIARDSVSFSAQFEQEHPEKKQIMLINQTAATVDWKSVKFCFGYDPHGGETLTEFYFKGSIATKDANYDVKLQLLYSTSGEYSIELKDEENTDAKTKTMSLSGTWNNVFLSLQHAIPNITEIQPWFGHLTWQSNEPPYLVRATVLPSSQNVYMPVSISTPLNSEQNKPVVIFNFMQTPVLQLRMALLRLSAKDSNNECTVHIDFDLTAMQNEFFIAWKYQIPKYDKYPCYELRIEQANVVPIIPEHLVNLYLPPAVRNIIHAQVSVQNYKLEKTQNTYMVQITDKTNCIVTYVTRIESVFLRAKFVLVCQLTDHGAFHFKRLPYYNFPSSKQHSESIYLYLFDDESVSLRSSWQHEDSVSSLQIHTDELLHKIYNNSSVSILQWNPLIAKCAPSPNLLNTEYFRIMQAHATWNMHTCTLSIVFDMQDSSNSSIMLRQCKLQILFLLNEVTHFEWVPTTCFASNPTQYSDVVVDFD